MSSVIQKLGRSDGIYEHTMHDQNGYFIFAKDLFYMVDGLRYTITIIEGKVFKIVWDR